MQDEVGFMYVLICPKIKWILLLLDVSIFGGRVLYSLYEETILVLGAPLEAFLNIYMYVYIGNNKIVFFKF